MGSRSKVALVLIAMAVPLAVGQLDLAKCWVSTTGTSRQPYELHGGAPFRMLITSDPQYPRVGDCFSGRDRDDGRCPKWVAENNIHRTYEALNAAHSLGKGIPGLMASPARIMGHIISGDFTE